MNTLSREIATIRTMVDQGIKRIADASEENKPCPACGEPWSARHSCGALTAPTGGTNEVEQFTKALNRQFNRHFKCSNCGAVLADGHRCFY